MTSRERVLAAFAPRRARPRAALVRRVAGVPRQGQAPVEPAGRRELLRPLRRRFPPRLRPLRRAGSSPFARRHVAHDLRHRARRARLRPAVEPSACQCHAAANPRLSVARSELAGRVAHPRRGARVEPPVRHPRRRLVAVLARRDRPARHGDALPQDVRRAGIGGRGVADIWSTTTPRSASGSSTPRPTRSTSSSSATISAARTARCSARRSSTASCCRTWSA